MKPNLSKPIVLLSGIILLLTAITLISMGLWVGPGGHQDRQVFIPPNTTTAAISRLLKKEHVINSSWLFRLAARLSGQGRLLKVGEYQFGPRTSIGTALEKIARGEVIHYAITIPEGYTASQIGEKLEAMNIVEKNAFLEAVNNPDLAAQVGVPAASMEGFLFPDTYNFPKGMAPAAIVRRMVANFFQKTKPILEKKGPLDNQALVRLVTMASIIEREVKVDKERPVVASVFYNRLAKGQRLESCATVLYSQGRIGGTLSTEDLFFKSPYNTYRHRGLPPGPISNPGLPSLEAAAFPAKTDYLFFVVGRGGEHVFSKDFEAHKLAKWRLKHHQHHQKTTP